MAFAVDSFTKNMIKWRRKKKIMENAKYEFDDFSKGSNNKEYNDATIQAEEMSSIIRTLIRARINQNMTQKELAIKAHVSLSAVAKIEKLDTSPKLETVISLAFCLGVSITAKEDKKTK